MIREKSCVFFTEKPIQYFENAEEVWFWFCLCETTPKGHSGSMKRTMRPCETSDVAIIIKRLVLDKTLTQEHLKVLSMYGLKQFSPSEKCGDPLRHCFLWKQAFERLSNVFKIKGIVRPVSCVVGM